MLYESYAFLFIRELARRVSLLFCLCIDHSYRQQSDRTAGLALYFLTSILKSSKWVGNSLVTELNLCHPYKAQSVHWTLQIGQLYTVMNWCFIKLIGIVIFFQYFLLENIHVRGKNTEFCKVGRESIRENGETRRRHSLGVMMIMMVYCMKFSKTK